MNNLLTLFTFAIIIGKVDKIDVFALDKSSFIGNALKDELDNSFRYGVSTDLITTVFLEILFLIFCFMIDLIISFLMLS